MTLAFPVLMPVYDRADVYFERGEGVWLYDDKGERYLDFVGGIAVTALGHAHPQIVKALEAQARRLWTVSNLYFTHEAERLAQRLVDLSFADTVFFQNSGVEAWDCGIKVIRKYFSSIGQPERYRVITMEGCFHGRSLSAIAASKSDKMVKGFGPVMDGFDVVPWGDIEALRSAVSEATAAVCLEPVMGEGGLRVAPPAFLREVRQLCDTHGLLLYYDEIQCGLGRTGKLFAYEHSGVAPDVMCLAKALGNGFPIGACLATAKAAQGMTVGAHGSTYGGNPLATAVGYAVLSIICEPAFLADVDRKGEHLAARLDELVTRHPKIFAERRGVGLIQGLKCLPPNKELMAALLREKLLTVIAGDNVLRLLPPLIITREDIDAAASILDRIAAQISGV